MPYALAVKWCWAKSNCLSASIVRDDRPSGFGLDPAVAGVRRRKTKSRRKNDIHKPTFKFFLLFDVKVLKIPLHFQRPLSFILGSATRSHYCLQGRKFASHCLSWSTTISFLHPSRIVPAGRSTWSIPAKTHVFLVPLHRMLNMMAPSGSDHHPSWKCRSDKIGWEEQAWRLVQLLNSFL